MLIPDLPGSEISFSREAQSFASKINFQKIGNVNHWQVSSDIAPAGKERIPSKNPSWTTALIFSRLCHMNGVHLPDPQSGNLDKKSRILSVHESETSTGIAEKALEHSNNMVAELLLMKAAQKLSGKAQNIRDSAQTIQNWVVRTFSLPSPDSLYLTSGSGLNPEDQITPMQFVTILKAVDRIKFLIDLLKLFFRFRAGKAH